MQNGLWTKGIVVGIILLFIGTSAISSIGPTHLLETNKNTAQSSHQIGVSGVSSWWNNNWTYRIPITIDHKKVAGDLINFPVLVETTMGSD